MLELATPWALILLPLPLILMRFLPVRVERGAALFVPDTVGTALLAQGGQGGNMARRVSRSLPWVIWVLLVLALTGPRQLEPIPALNV